jgi:hypothetical protein
MKKITILLLLLSQLSVLSQDYKFGKVSKEELEEQFYPLDSTADAAYLYKYRKTYFNFDQEKGFQIITEIHERVKIYKKEGFKYATTFINYYTPETGDNQKISSIKGYVFNSNQGKVTKSKLSNKDVFLEHKSKYWSVKKVTMPNIKIGSVIELKYKISSPFKFISELEFQYGIPVKKIECKVTIPEYYIYNIKMKGHYFINPIKSEGYESLTIRSKSRSSEGGLSFTNTTYSNNEIKFATNIKEFNAINIPALKDNEPFVSSIENYRGGVKFELASTNFIKVGGKLKHYASTWEDVSKQIFKASNFSDELNKSSYYKDDLKNILATAKTDSDKMIGIFQFVKKQVKWNGLYDKYTDKGVRKAYKERVGNSADINLMLISMLRSAGLDANPVLVSTRKNGVPLFPTIDGFNYVISIVDLKDGGSVLLDASEEFSLPNLLPTRTLNWKGRKVNKNGGSSWVELTSSKHASEENYVMVKISDDMMVEGMIRTKFHNLNALNYRKNKNHIKEEDLITKLEEKDKIEIEDYKVLNKRVLGKSVVRNVKFLSEDLIEEINGKLYVEPLLFLSEHKNPFKLDDRKFPVDFATPWVDRNTVSIQVPEGYQIETLPAPLAIGLPGNLGVFKYEVSQQGNKISTVSVLQFNKGVIGAQYYPQLKDFYGQVVKKESEKIVLIKL